MKKIILVTMICFCSMLVGCIDANKDNNTIKVVEINGYRFEIVEIEGHKYIIMDGKSSNMVHAESCRCVTF